jgi:hypothetical protein
VNLDPLVQANYDRGEEADRLTDIATSGPLEIARNGRTTPPRARLGRRYTRPRRSEGHVSRDTTASRTTRPSAAAVEATSTTHP